MAQLHIWRHASGRSLVSGEDGGVERLRLGELIKGFPNDTIRVSTHHTNDFCIKRQKVKGYNKEYVAVKKIIYTTELFQNLLDPLKEPCKT